MAWAAKTVEDGFEVDYAGDGSADDISVRKRKITRKGSASDTSLATSRSFPAHNGKCHRLRDSAHCAGSDQRRGWTQIARWAYMCTSRWSYYVHVLERVREGPI